MSTEAVLTASSACRPGTTSPAAKVWIWNLLSVASATYFEKVCAVPKMVSSDFGKLEVRRHLISGADWAIAGAATSVVAPATAPPLRNVRRFIMGSLPWMAVCSIARLLDCRTVGWQGCWMARLLDGKAVGWQV